MNPPVMTAITAKPDENRLAQTLLSVAWLAILLGLALEGIMLLIAANSAAFPSTESIVADSVQKISWSGLVCTGLAVGKAATRANPTWMAFAGLVSAPTALAVARILHKSTAQALTSIKVGGPAAFPFFIAGLKGVEYAALGFLLGWLGRRAGSGILAYGSGGFLIGAVFGSAIAVASTPGGFATTAIIPALVNEVLFPVGCALAIYVADAIGKQVGAKSAISADC